MVDRNLIRELDGTEDALEAQVLEMMEGADAEALSRLYEQSVRDFQVGKILKGRVVKVQGDEVVVDVGYKSEGLVPLSEFRDQQPTPGDEIDVLLEEVEDDSGLIVLSKRRADRIRGWQHILSTHKEGDVVTGRVTRKIKGGLLVDIGVPAFLPASQVNIRRTGDVGEYVGREIQCKILKIDEGRRNIVVSRRKLLEEEREKAKRKLLAEIEVGQLRKGVVKNIADFGAFVDLGGIDGLLHITDMSWGRVGHPSEVVSIDQEIEVMVLKFDKERGRIALGLKQKTQSPWLTVKERYPVGSKVQGTVVNIMPYGAFVKLEDGIEGLVHISEMSWTRRINHPSEVVNIGDVVEVMVLDINVEKQEISLGMKQTEVNPWELVEQRYPPGTIIEGTVRNITSYGAFVEIEEGIDGLLHVSDMSWTKKINHPSEILKKGDRVKAVVLTVDPAKKRVALGIKQLQPDPWSTVIPDKYVVGEIVTGKVTKITNFGVFVELEDGLEGLLHISELSDRKVHSPEEVVKVGKRVNVRILKVDPQERKIGLSMIDVEQPTEEEIKEAEASEKRAEEEGVKTDEAPSATETSGGDETEAVEETEGGSEETPVEDVPVSEASETAAAITETEGEVEAEGTAEGTDVGPQAAEEPTPAAPSSTDEESSRVGDEAVTEVSGEEAEPSTEETTREEGGPGKTSEA